MAEWPSGRMTTEDNDNDGNNQGTHNSRHGRSGESRSRIPMQSPEHTKNGSQREGEREREREKENRAKGKGSGGLWEINQPVGRPGVR